MKKNKDKKNFVLPVAVLVLGIVAFSLFFKQESEVKKEIDIKKEVKVEEKKETTIKKVEEKTKKKPLTVAQKKQRFRDLLVPAVNKVYDKLYKQYRKIEALMKTSPNDEEIERLKKEYKAKSNEDLLLRLKPHPKSVTLAQAAIESAWATSRFFNKANNIFGVWSFNKNEPRIPAGQTRGTKTIYLKKYNSIEDAVLDYYKVLSKGSPYHKFRVQNYDDPNPYKLVTFLTSYSEKGTKYGEILISVISHNKFIEYDDKFYKRPPKKVKKEPVKMIENKKVQDSNTSVEVKKEQIKVEDSNITKTQKLDMNSSKSIDVNATSIQ